MHFALIVLDGLGDRPHPDTGNVSPVEAASTPHLDRLALMGRMGRVEVIGPGIAPESDAGVLALLGLDPARESPGRGVLEALGIGIDLAPGDVAFRANFATGAGDGTITDSRVGRTLGTDEARGLARSITEANLLSGEAVRAEFRATVGHRGVLVLHPLDGRVLSSEVTNSDPFYERVGGMGQAVSVRSPKPLAIRPLHGRPGEARTASLVTMFLERSAGVLAGHSINARRALAGKKIANSLLLRSAGSLPEKPTSSFRDRTGLEGAAITEMPVERGIARWLDLVDRFVGPMGADRDAALRERAELTRQALVDHEFVYVHLKGPDEPGHDGRAVAKKEVVEALDRSYFGPFMAGIDLERDRIVVTADHATPCVLRAHSDDPVPLLLAGSGVVPDAHGGTGPKFGESSASRGSLGTVRGVDVLSLLRGSPRPDRP